MEEQKGTHGWLEVVKTPRNTLQRGGVRPLHAAREGPRGAPSTSGGDNFGRRRGGREEESCLA